MQRKDYQIITSVFANTKATSYEEHGMRDCLIDRMADALARVNPQFDRAKFQEACNPR